MINMGIFLACLMVLLFCVFQLFIYKIAKGFQPPVQRMDLVDLIDILNETIKREFLQKYKLNYELRDIKMIYDFQKDLHELVTDSLTAFSEDFMKQLEFYYDRTYIIKYVTKSIEIMLLEFTKEKKIKTK